MARHGEAEQDMARQGKTGKDLIQEVPNHESYVAQTHLAMRSDAGIRNPPSPRPPCPHAAFSAQATQLQGKSQMFIPFCRRKAQQHPSLVKQGRVLERVEGHRSFYNPYVLPGAGQAQMTSAHPKIPSLLLSRLPIGPERWTMRRQSLQRPNTEPFPAEGIGGDSTGPNANLSQTCCEHQVLTMSRRKLAPLEIWKTNGAKGAQAFQQLPQVQQGAARKANPGATVVVRQAETGHFVELTSAQIMGIQRVQPLRYDEQPEVLGDEKGVPLQATVPPLTTIMDLAALCRPLQHMQKLDDGVE